MVWSGYPSLPPQRHFPAERSFSRYVLATINSKHRTLKPSVLYAVERLVGSAWFESRSVHEVENRSARRTCDQDFYFLIEHSVSTNWVLDSYP
jgi:hypothetical protein